MLRKPDGAALIRASATNSTNAGAAAGCASPVRCAAGRDKSALPSPASIYHESGLSALQARSQGHAAGTAPEPTRIHLRAPVGWPHEEDGCGGCSCGRKSRHGLFAQACRAQSCLECAAPPWGKPNRWQEPSETRPLIRQGRSERTAPEALGVESCIQPSRMAAGTSAPPRAGAAHSRLLRSAGRTLSLRLVPSGRFLFRLSLSGSCAFSVPANRPSTPVNSLGPH